MNVMMVSSVSVLNVSRVGSILKKRELVVKTRAGQGPAVERRPEEQQQLEQPNWTGNTVASRLVNAAISSPLLFGLMKMGARQQMIMTAEKNGIPWGADVEELKNSERLMELYNGFCREAPSNLEYPEYYTQAFHGYDSGNMNWLAAYEAEAATYSMAMRVWKDEEGLTADVAQNRLRDAAHDVVKKYMQSNECLEVKDVLDVGCSVGVSTRFLAEAFPDAHTVTGLDLSPYFLSVAELRREQGATAYSSQGTSDGGPSSYEKVKYVQGNAECTAFPSESFDVISCQFIMHELPPEPTRQIAKECMRLLRPGGVIFIVDNDPRSAVIQNLPAPLFTLMKSTEPHSDEYYAFDQEECLREAGFDAVFTTACDPRHRVITAKKSS